MRRKHLMICEEEFSYANSLMENILDRKELAVRVSICTNVQKVVLMLQECEADMVLITEEWLEIAKEALWGKEVTVLTESRQESDVSPYPTLYKYQSADMIVASLFEQTGVYCRVREEKQILEGVYSPVHRCGKTSFAMALAREWGKYKQTLYINLETYPGTYPCLRGMAGNHLGDFLYYIKQDCADSGLRLSAMVRKEEGLHYLAPIGRASDLKEVTLEDWELFFAEVAKSSYEVLVLDFGESIQGLPELLNRCSHLYMPILPEEAAREKVSCFKEESRQNGYGAMADRFQEFSKEQNVRDLVAEYVGISHG